ncbi:LIM/homeobox protein Lhx9-like [Ischnura elegans]|uniref:LIM/homeobox protein Lhx9-like n=1 Tax=Ischnura elegans TaxID=197161 RepID=UPI001ED86A04|nr:LIM/homeobox protein Lhx9-like [Ischnura elegans]
MGGPDAAEDASSGAACCFGCGGRICDRFYLLAVDRQWHSGCLKCCECKLPLHSELTCFARGGNIYCKEDYYRLFAVKRCGRCRAGISASELVMRAREAVYHLQCFTCATCDRPLTKGEHFGMREGLVYCRPHYALLFPPPWGGKGRPRKRKASVAEAEMVPMRLAPSGSLEMLHAGDLPPAAIEQLAAFDSSSSVASPGSGGSGMGQGGGQQRTKRMRTSFKHHQLRTMKSYFAINQNPDAKDLKQLAQKTGLSKRVLQVWFQNARAKWRRNIMRQESQQQGGAAPPCPSPPPSDHSAAPGGHPTLQQHQPGTPGPPPSLLGGPGPPDGLCAPPPPAHLAGPDDLASQAMQFSDLY